MSDMHDVTLLLQRWRAGDAGALDAAIPLLYDELSRLAHARLRREDAGHTLDTGGLVHEAYMRLVDIRSIEWRDRAHFLAMASRTMRRVLIDHAAGRNTEKRGGAFDRVAFPADLAVSTMDAATLLELNDALTQLEAESPRAAKAVELRFFGGLTLAEVAEVLETSAPTAMRDLRFAQAWLARALT